MLERPSEHSRNIYGNIGSPYRIPRVDLNVFENTPLTLTENETDETHFITSERQESGKARACMMAFR